MSSLDSSLPQNTTLVHPPFFFLSGLHNVPSAKYLYIFLCFVFVVTVLVNSSVIFIIYKESRFHTPKHMPFFNLAVADLGASSAFIPNLVTAFLFDSQYISFDACLANMFFVYYFNNLQSLMLTVMAFDRLVAICLPLRYHAIITMPVMVVICTVAWAFTALFMFSVLALITRLSFCKSIVVESYFCGHGSIVGLACNNNNPNRVVGFIADIFFWYSPLILVILSYVFIARGLTKIASWKGRIKAIKTCSAQIMQVVLYYSRYIATYIASFFHHIHPNIGMINTILSISLRPTLNPIIYVLNTEEMKEFLKKKILEKRKTNN